MKTERYLIVFLTILFCVPFLAATPRSLSTTLFEVEIEENSSSFSVSLTDNNSIFNAQVLRDASNTDLRSRTTGVIGKPGAAALPAWTRWIEVPGGQSPVLEIEPGEYRIERDVELSTFPTHSDNPEFLKLGQSLTEVISQDAFLPPEMATLSSTVRIGETSWVLLAVTPYRYNSVSRELHVYDNFNAEVRFESAAGADDYLNRTIPPVYRELNRALRDDSPGRDDYGLRVDNLGHYVIVVPDNEEIIEAVEPLVEWKKRKGYLVTVLNIEDIGGEADDLQRYLLDGWNNWDVPPTFVLLVGDGNGDADFTLPTFRHNPGPGQSWHVSDNLFVTFDGAPLENNNVEGWTPDAFIGRLPIESVQDAEHQIAKIIGYEMEPFTDEDWCSGALLIAAGVHSCIQTNEAIRDLMLEAGFDIDNIVEEYTEYHYNEHPDLSVIRDAVDDGIGFVNFRGYNNWGNYPHNDPNSRENGWMLPIVTGMVCGTNDFTDVYEGAGMDLTVGEGWIRGWRNNDPAGAVAVFGPTDLYTHTWFNNVMDAEFYYALLQKDIRTLGALTVASKLALVRNYPSFLSMSNGLAVGYYFHTYVLLGDPGLQVWVQNPRDLIVDFDSALPQGSNLIELSVSDDIERSVAGAYVHIYLDGEDNEVRYGGFTDSDGNLSLIVDPLEEGSYALTVTGPDLVPLLESIEVTRSTVFIALDDIAIDDDDDGESDGNGDGTANPGETLELTSTVRNSGYDQSDEFTVRLESESQWVEILRDEVDFEALDADDQAQGTPFEVRVLDAAPDGMIIDFNLIVGYGEFSWTSAFTLTVSGFRFLVYDFGFDGVLNPGTERELVIDIANIGDLETEDLLGTLDCSDAKVQIRRPEATFDAIPVDDIGNNGDNPFLVFAGPDSYQGKEVEFTLSLQDEAGRVGNVSFMVNLGAVSENSPQGPDEYGYFVFDAADTSTGLTVDYDWIEAETRVNDLQDNDDRGNWAGVHGSSTVIDIPFEFAYYGQRFNRITIGSNGWLALGEHEHVAWHNQEMGNSMAPGGMIAPLWKDLWSGNVYTLYDEDEARFVIEWRGYSSEQGGATFEVILLDQSVYPSATGDGDIIFQYNRIPGGQRDFASEATTIGICSPDRQTVSQVSFAGDWDERTPRFGHETALRFSTGEYNDFGAVTGRVIQTDTEEAVEHVRVMIDGTGFFDHTDAEGSFRIDRIPVGGYSMTAYKRHYNNDTAADIQIQDGEVARVDFSLTYPLFRADIEEIIFGVQPGGEGEVPFTVSNDGIGPLDYNIFLDFDVDFDANRDQPWDQLFVFNATEATGEYNDESLSGVTFIDDELYVSGQGSAGPTGLPHKLYVFNRQGEMVRDVDQYTYDEGVRGGYTDIVWTGENILAIEGGVVLVISDDNEFVRVIETGLRRPQAITYNPDNGTMFVRTITGSEFKEFDMDGEIVETYYSGDEDLWTHGMAWHPEDPDGYNLYIFAESRDPNPVTELQLHKLNTETGDIMFVREFILSDDDTTFVGDRPRSIEITKYWDPLRWSLIMLVSHGDGDRIHVFELGPNLTWIDPQPETGTIPAGDEQTITVSFYSEDLPEQTYEIMLEVRHNAEGDHYDIPISFTVDEDWLSVVEDAQPVGFTIESIWPNPFNPTTQIGFSLPSAELVSMTVWDITGRRIDEVEFGKLSAGGHTVAWNGKSQPSGLYIVRLTAGMNSVSQKMILIK